MLPTLVERTFVTTEDGEVVADRDAITMTRVEVAPFVKEGVPGDLVEHPLLGTLVLGETGKWVPCVAEQDMQEITDGEFEAVMDVRVLAVDWFGAAGDELDERHELVELGESGGWRCERCGAESGDRELLAEVGCSVR